VKTLRVTVTPPLKVAEVLRKIDSGTVARDEIKRRLISSYAAEPEPPRLGVINAFTRAAQNLGPLQRIELVELFAGTLLDARL